MGMIRPIMTSEVRRMRELLASGMTRHQVAQATGRCVHSVSRYAGDVAPPTAQAVLARQRMLHRCQRIERLFTACNRAIAEARS